MQAYLIQTPIASFIFVFTLVTSLYTFYNPHLYAKFMLHPYSIARGQKVFSVLSSGLIHKDWGHLLFNMLTFFFFGFSLESILASASVWGHLQFTLIYVAGMVLSDLPTIYKHRNSINYYSLGASGAICAVLFSFIMFQPKAMLGVFLIIPMPAWIFGFLFLAYCAWAAKQSRDSINHDAHFYGALVGVVLTLIFHPWTLNHFIKSVF
jgi:membrane associated rhomboid family serine protease